MSLRLYRLDVECTGYKCSSRVALRVTEAEMRAHRHTPPEAVVLTAQCPWKNCKALIPIRAKHIRAATLDGVLPLPVTSLPPELPTVALPAEDAAVCALVVDGKSDDRIVLALGITRRALRRTLGRVAKKMRKVDASLPAARPRNTIAAYFARRAGPADSVEIFGVAA